MSQDAYAVGAAPEGFYAAHFLGVGQEGVGEEAARFLGMAEDGGGEEEGEEGVAEGFTD